MTQSKSFLNNFSNAMAAEKSVTQQVAPTPLSDKTGINTVKKTALQQGIIQSISQPAGLMQQGA